MGGLRTRKYASLKVCRRCGWGDCAPASTPVSRYVGDVDGGLRTPASTPVSRYVGDVDGGLRTPASTPVSRYVGDVDGGTAHPQVRQSQGM